MSKIESESGLGSELVELIKRLILSTTERICFKDGVDDFRFLVFWTGVDEFRSILRKPMSFCFVKFLTGSTVKTVRF